MAKGVAYLIAFIAGDNRERTGYLHSVQRSPGNDPRQWSRRSWIAFLGGLALLAAALIATGLFPVLSTARARRAPAFRVIHR
jgi:hypothetical protein